MEAKIVCLLLTSWKLSTLLQNGVVSLIDCTLMEEPEGTDDESKSLRAVNVYQSQSNVYFYL